MTSNREHAVTEAFVSLATSLADGVEAVELLTGLTRDCADILDVASAGLLLADQHRVLHVMAASSEDTRALELFQLQREQGPCLDCFTSGEPVSVADLSEHMGEWPDFVSAAARVGLVSVHAVPVRLRDLVLGTLGLFGSTTGQLERQDLDLAQALAYVAAVALVQERAASDRNALNAQLQTALTSRIALEQAKGAISHVGNVDMDRAFAVLRGYARDNNYRLSAVARAVASRDVPPQLLLEHAARHEAHASAEPARRRRSRPARGSS